MSKEQSTVLLVEDYSWIFLFCFKLSWSVYAAITKMPQTGWLKQHLFFIVLEAMQSKIKVLAVRELSGYL